MRYLRRLSDRWWREWEQTYNWSQESIQRTIGISTKIGLYLLLLLLIFVITIAIGTFSAIPFFITMKLLILDLFYFPLVWCITANAITGMVFSHARKRHLLAEIRQLRTDARRLNNSGMYMSDKPDEEELLECRMERLGLL